MGTYSRSRRSRTHRRLANSGQMPTISEVEVATAYWPQQYSTSSGKSNCVPADKGSFFSLLGRVGPGSLVFYDACRNASCDSSPSASSSSTGQKRSCSDSLAIAGEALREALESGDEWESRQQDVKDCPRLSKPISFYSRRRKGSQPKTLAESFGTDATAEKLLDMMRRNRSSTRDKAPGSNCSTAASNRRDHAKTLATSEEHQSTDLTDQGGELKVTSSSLDAVLLLKLAPNTLPKALERHTLHTSSSANSSDLWTGDSAQEVRGLRDRSLCAFQGIATSPMALQLTESLCRQNGSPLHRPPDQKTLLHAPAPTCSLYSPSFPEEAHASLNLNTESCTRTQPDAEVGGSLTSRLPASDSRWSTQSNVREPPKSTPSLQDLVLDDVLLKRKKQPQEDADSGTEAAESVQSSETNKGSIYDLMLKSPSPEQLAIEIQRRQEGLEKLVAFYNAWVQRLGKLQVTNMIGCEPRSQAAADLASTQDLESAELHPSEPLESSSRRPDSVVTAFSELSRTPEASKAEVKDFGTVHTLSFPGGGRFRGILSQSGRPDGLGRYEAEREPGEDFADLYEGEFCRGDMEGYGVYLFGNCGWYSGQWIKGRQQGYGKQIFANGTMCLGKFGRHGRLNGFGVCLYPSGDIYEGEFKNGIPHGRGHHKAANNSDYAGSFVDGRRRGIGAYRFSNGDCFAGTFDCDHPCGHGAYVTKRQERLEGQFRSGQVHGWGVRIFPDGAVAAGKWRNGTLRWSRVLRDLDFDDIPDADAEGIDIAQEVARNARHTAEQAERAARSAREASRVSEAVRRALKAAERADASSKLAARMTSE